MKKIVKHISLLIMLTMLAMWTPVAPFIGDSYVITAEAASVKLSTDCQYKGFLLDNLDRWKEIRELLSDNKEEEALKKIDRLISIISEKLKF